MVISLSQLHISKVVITTGSKNYYQLDNSLSLFLSIGGRLKLNQDLVFDSFFFKFNLLTVATFSKQLPCVTMKRALLQEFVMM